MGIFVLEKVVLFIFELLTYAYQCVCLSVTLCECGRLLALYKYLHSNFTATSVNVTGNHFPNVLSVLLSLLFHFTSLHPEDEGSKVLRNGGILSHHYAASQPIRPRVESS